MTVAPNPFSLTDSMEAIALRYQRLLDAHLTSRQANTSMDTPSAGKLLAECLADCLIFANETPVNCQFYQLNHDHIPKRLPDETICAHIEALLGVSVETQKAWLRAAKVQSQDRCIESSSVLAVGFQGDNRPAWVRLKFTEDECSSISIDDIPEYCDFAERIIKGAEL